MLNPDLIEHVEVTPDTVITLTNGHQFMVLESADEILNRVIEFRRAICGRLLQSATARSPEEALPGGSQS